MRISREDSTDLGIVMYSLTFGAIDVHDVSKWASKAIDESPDSPTFLYTMLDLKGLFGKDLREEIGFQPGFGMRNDDEAHFIRQIAVRRGLQPYSYLGPAANIKLPAEREAYINGLFMHNFGIDVNQLPPLSDFKS
jgi:hypothetical protein